MVQPRVLLVLAVAASACGGSKQKAIPTSPASPPPPTLAAAIELVEVREDGKRKAVPAGGVVEIDVNSQVEVTLKPEVLAALAAKLEPAPATPAERKQLEALAEATAQQVELVERVNEVSAQVRASAAADAITPAALAPLEALEGAGMQLAPPPGLRIMLDGGAPVANPDAEQIDEARRQALDAAAEKGVLALRLQAVLVRGDRSTPVHLPNYDSLDPEAFSLIDKLVPAITARELGAQLKEANKLAKDLKDLKTARAKFFAQMRDAGRDMARKLDEALTKDRGQLDELAAELANGVLKELPSAKVLVQQLTAVVPRVKRVAEACKPVLDENAELMDLIARASTCAGSIAAEVKPIVDGLTRAAEAAVKLKDEAAGADLTPAFQAVIAKLETVKRIREGLDRARPALDALGRLLGIKDDVTEATFTDDKQVDVPIGKATDTSIDLRFTSRKKGDALMLRPAIMKGDASALVGTSQAFKVVQNGARIDVSAGVLFLDTIGDEHWGFEASPAVVAAVHHHNAREDGKTHGHRFWNAVDPGIGLHFGSPDLGGEDGGEDPDAEIAFGVSGVLFGDLLQVGAGRELRTGSNYWYVGFGLASLTKLGVSFNP